MTNSIEPSAPAIQTIIGSDAKELSNSSGGKPQPSTALGASLAVSPLVDGDRTSSTAQQRKVAVAAHDLFVGRLRSSDDGRTVRMSLDGLMGHIPGSQAEKVVARSGTLGWQGDALR